MDLPSPGSSLVSAHQTDPITPHPSEGKGLSGASSEMQMQSADFSGNAVGLILIPGSTGKIKRGSAGNGNGALQRKERELGTSWWKQPGF